MITGSSSRQAARVILVAIAAAALGMSCGTPSPRPSAKLVWSEEFETAGAPDPASWGYETGQIRNQEAQYYMEGRPENARVENGCLVIEARREDYGMAHYTSASLNTLGKREFFRGRIEVRARIPTGRGSWPAIWMMGTNIPTAGWPECGEIDIMENVGYEPDTIYATVHTPGSVNDPGRVVKGGHIDVTRPFDDFHVYAVEWREDRLEFSCDDVRYFSYAKDDRYPAYWRFDRPFYLLLNLAIGGTWGGAQGIDDAIFPLRYDIDYVRYYRGD
jgi:beta-glucanase (GH16 family)